MTNETMERQVYLDLSAGEAGSARLNVRNGKGYFTKPLMEFIGENLPLSLSLNYNSGNKDTSQFCGINTGFAKGWLTNYHGYCKKIGSDYIYIDSLGEQHIFALAENSPAVNCVYFDKRGTGAVLIESLDIKIMPKLNEEIRFDGSGKVAEYRVKRNTLWTSTFLEYNASGYLSRITDSMDNFINFNYLDQKIEIIDSSNRKCVIATTSSNDLSGSYKDINGVQTDICTYNKVYNIMSFASPSGNLVQFEFTNGAVIKASEKIVKTGSTKTVSEYNLVYSFCTTQVTNHKGLVKRYHFAETGESLSSYEVKDGVCYGGSFANIEDFQRYGGRITENYSMKAKFGDNFFTTITPGHATNSTSIVSGGALPQYALFTAEAEFVNNNSATAYDCKVSVIAGGITRGTLSFDSRISGKQIAAVSIQVGALSSGNPYAQIGYASGARGSVKISNVKLVEGFREVERGCANVNTGYGAAFIESEQTWYSLGKVNNIRLSTAMVTSVSLTERDMLANADNYFNKVGNFNVWYNNQKNLIANVNNLEYRFANGNFYGVADVKIGNLSSIKGDILLKYGEYSGSDYKTITISEKGNSSKLSELTTHNKLTKMLKSSVEYPQLIKEHTYDLMGNCTSTKMSTNNASENMLFETSYTSGRLHKEKEYIGDQVRETQINSSPTAITSITNPKNNTVNYGYTNTFADKLAEVSAMELSNLNKNSILYDSEFISSLSSSGTSYSFTYDQFNRISDVKINNASICSSLFSQGTQFDETTVTYANGATIKKQQDAYGRLIRVFFKNSSGAFEEKLSFIYSSDQDAGRAATSPTNASLKINENSLLCKVIDHITGQHYLYYYDLMDQPKDIELKNTASNTLVYKKILQKDSYQRLTSEEYGGIMKNEYTYNDSEFRLGQEIKKVKASSGASYIQEERSLDGLKRVRSKLHTLNGRYYSVSYTYANRMNGTTKVGTTPYIAGESGAAPDSTFKRFYHNYEYDANDNISKITTNSAEQIFTYDNVDRLTKATYPSSNLIIEYTYNAAGNITNKKSTNYHGGNLISDIPYVYANPKCGDALTSFNGKTITYDALYNPISYLGNTLSWERGKLLSSFSNAASGRICNYIYDSMGNRTRITTKSGSTIISDKTQIRDGHKLLKEKNLLPAISSYSYDVTFMYTQSGVNGCYVRGSFYQFQKNILGDITAIYDSSLAVVASYNYDAFGKTTVFNANGHEDNDPISIGNLNPFRYRGYYYDSETKLYHLQSRYYDPATGRFLNLDNPSYLDPESINGLNLFAYCLNNPINYVDPTGCFVITASTAALIGLFAILFAGVVIIETTLHPIENTIKAIGDGIDYLVNDIDWAATGEESVNWSINPTNTEIMTAQNIKQAVNFDYYFEKVYDPDPFARSGQKKQGREKKAGSRRQPGWESKSNKRRPSPPKPHTPGKDHKKFFEWIKYFF